MGRLAGNHGLDLHLRAASADIAELVSGNVRQVDDSPAMERAAIVDAYDDPLAAADMRDAHVARDRQRRVRGGHLVHVVGFAARGLLAVKLLAIPARRAALAERL